MKVAPFGQPPKPWNFQNVNTMYLKLEQIVVSIYNYNYVKNASYLFEIWFLSTLKSLN